MDVLPRIVIVIEVCEVIVLIEAAQHMINKKVSVSWVIMGFNTQYLITRIVQTARQL